MGSGSASPPPVTNTTQQHTWWPGYPTLAANPLSWSDRRHILHGDEDNEESGGHLAGTGRAGKTEFPPGWDEDECIESLVAVARQPEDAIERPNGMWEVYGTHRGIKIRAFIRPSGTVAAGHPISGPGVRRNPRTNT